MQGPSGPRLCCTRARTHTHTLVQGPRPFVMFYGGSGLGGRLIRAQGWPRRAEARSRDSRLAPRAEMRDSAPRAWPGPPGPGQAAAGQRPQQAGSAAHFELVSIASQLFE